MKSSLDSSNEEVRPPPVARSGCADERDSSWGAGEASPESEGNELEEAVKRALQDVRPALQMDGGDVELVRVTGDGIVFVRLVGACAGCPMSQMTLSQGVERRIRDAVPVVKKVLAI